MKPLPLPLRLAAGLVATAVEQARDLPRVVAELPITAVSQTLQASMRVQQKVTELAIKGDRALSLLVPAEEKPSWATFDEDMAEPAHPNGTSTVTELRPRPAFPDLDDEVAGPGRIDAVDDLDAVADAEAVELIEQAEDVEGGAAPPVEPPGPAVLPDYPSMTIPQLRGRLRFLSLRDLQALLVWETGHENRPPFVTMLTNRIAAVDE